VLMSEGSCDQRCGVCSRRTSPHELKDRKGYRFPVRTDIGGRSHVYNSVPLDLTDALSEVLSGGVSAVRLDLELEGVEEAASIVRRMRRVLAGEKAAREAGGSGGRGQTTSGHFFRGLV